jgi:hypothetical protein
MRERERERERERILFQNSDAISNNSLFTFCFNLLVQIAYFTFRLTASAYME